MSFAENCATPYFFMLCFCGSVINFCWYFLAGKMTCELYDLLSMFARENCEDLPKRWLLRFQMNYRNCSIQDNLIRNTIVTWRFVHVVTWHFMSPSRRLLISSYKFIANFFWALVNFAVFSSFFCCRSNFLWLQRTVLPVLKHPRSVPG